VTVDTLTIRAQRAFRAGKFPESRIRPFESLPVLLTVTRDQQIAQLGFVPGEWKRALSRDATTAKRPILNTFLKIRTLVLNLRSLTIARNFRGR
jgi:hypothetical protein